MKHLARLIILIMLAGLQAAAARAETASPGSSEAQEAVFSRALESFGAGRYEEAASGAIECAASPGAGVWEGRAVFLAARSFAAMGDAERAAAYFEGALEKYPALADYSLWLLAGFYQSNKMHAQAAASYTRLADEHPNSRLVNGALMSAARARIETGEFEAALVTLDRLLAKRTSSAISAEALHLKAKVLAAAGKAFDAWSIERRVWLEYPESPFADEGRALAGQAGERKDLPAPGYEDYLKRADRLFDRWRYEAASQAYLSALGMMPAKSAARHAAHFRLGECSFKLRRYDDAVKSFAKSVELGADEDTAAEASYRMAWSYLRAGDGENFRKAALSCASRYPGSPWAAESLFILGAEYTYDKKYNEAAGLFEGILDKYPESALKPEVLWRLGWTDYKRSGFEAAAGTFERLASAYPNLGLAPTALYWQAKSLEKAGLAKKAKEVFERLDTEYGMSFYAFMAEANPGVSKPEAAGVAAAARFPVQSSYKDKTLARALELGIQEMAAEGVDETKLAEGRYSGSVWGLKVLAGLYGFLGEYRRPLELASHLYRTRINTGRQPIPDEVLAMAFPLGFRDIVVEQAGTFGADPFLAFSIIREESHFDPCVISPAGAVGLMQLMPKTARGLCEKLQMDFPTTGRLQDQCFNVPLGTCYIASLVEKHDGRLAYALAEYNAGPGALARWIKRMPDAQDDEFIEGISYPETRNYVKRVLRNFRVYRMLYGERARAR